MNLPCLALPYDCRLWSVQAQCDNIHFKSYWTERKGKCGHDGSQGKISSGPTQQQKSWLNELQDDKSLGEEQEKKNETDMKNGFERWAWEQMLKGDWEESDFTPFWKERSCEDLGDQCGQKKSKLVKCGCQGNSSLISISILPERAKETTSFQPFVILSEVCCPHCNTWTPVTHAVGYWDVYISQQRHADARWNPPESFLNNMVKWNKNAVCSSCF